MPSRRAKRGSMARHGAETYDELKQAGTEQFKAGAFAAARELYLQAAKQAASVKERAVAFNNAATAAYRANDFETCVEHATHALEAQPDYVKALYRRAQVSPSSAHNTRH